MDGITLKVSGLTDVSRYPDLFAELIRRGYRFFFLQFHLFSPHFLFLLDSDLTQSLPFSEQDLKKIAGLNVIRVLRQAEESAASLQSSGVLPYEDTIWPDSTTAQQQCRNAQGAQ